VRSRNATRVELSAHRVIEIRIWETVQLAGKKRRKARKAPGPGRSTTRKIPLNEPISEDEQDYSGALRFAEKYGRLLVSFLIPAILVSYSLYSYYGSDQEVVPGSWAHAVILVLTIFLALIAFLLVSLDLAAKMSNIRQTGTQRRLTTTTLLLVTTAAASANMYLFLLAHGYIQQVNEVLRSKVIPSVGSGLSYLLSNLLGWIISGLVGNGAFALAKAVLRRSDRPRKTSSISRHP
jgi:hypothetical protein